jgi:hypothetical protein
VYDIAFWKRGSTTTRYFQNQSIVVKNQCQKKRRSEKKYALKTAKGLISNECRKVKIFLKRRENVPFKTPKLIFPGLLAYADNICRPENGSQKSERNRSGLSLETHTPAECIAQKSTIPLVPSSYANVKQ